MFFRYSNNIALSLFLEQKKRRPDLAILSAGPCWAKLVQREARLVELFLSRRPRALCMFHLLNEVSALRLIEMRLNCYRRPRIKICCTRSPRCRIVNDESLIGCN